MGISRKIVAAAAVAAALTVALAGCGGGGGGGGSGSGGGGSSGGGKVVELSMSEFKFSPSTVTLDGPGTYTFKATNDGGIQHAIGIEGNGVDEESDVVGAGQTATLTVDLESGDYELYCPVDSHKDQGMEGKITVS